MGKKRITKQTEEEVLEERDQTEAAVKKASLKSVKTKITSGEVHINASYNNTMISVSDERGNVLSWSSAGSLGFKGAKKSTPYAASRVAEAVCEKVKKVGLENVRVYIRGIGNGRESAVRYL